MGWRTGFELFFCEAEATAQHIRMSAFEGKADIAIALQNVRF